MNAELFILPTSQKKICFDLLYIKHQLPFIKEIIPGLVNDILLWGKE